MPKLSAGIMVYKKVSDSIEIFLVHPGGPFWAKKDDGAWSVPKGEYIKDEDAWTAAIREFTEETGLTVPKGKRYELGEVRYGNKHLTVWAVEGEMDAAVIKSNTISIEWPPKSGQQQEIPEIDKAGWFAPVMAEKKLVKGQAPLVQSLLKALNLHVSVLKPDKPIQPQLTLF